MINSTLAFAGKFMPRIHCKILRIHHIFPAILQQMIDTNFLTEYLMRINPSFPLLQEALPCKRHLNLHSHALCR